MRMSEKHLVKQWNAVRPRRRQQIHPYVQLCCLGENAEWWGIQAVFEVVIQLCLVWRCRFYQSQSSSRDQDEDHFFLLFAVPRCYSYCLFDFLLLRSNSFSLMNCGHCSLNQGGKELFDSFVFWLVSFPFVAFTVESVWVINTDWQTPSFTLELPKRKAHDSFFQAL